MGTLKIGTRSSVVSQTKIKKLLSIYELPFSAAIRSNQTNPSPTLYTQIHFMQERCLPFKIVSSLRVDKPGAAE